MADKVTSLEVAALAGVSQSAVSRVFTPGSSVSKKTADKVLAAATQRVPALADAGRTRQESPQSRAAIRRIGRRYPRAAPEGKLSAPILDEDTAPGGASWSSGEVARRGPRTNITQPARPPASSAGISGRL